MINIAENLDRAAASAPEKVAMSFAETTLTYAELQVKVGQTANLLQSLGVKYGDRVALFLPNCPEFVIAYYGIQRLGAIAASFNALLKCTEVRSILHDCTPNVLITTADLVAEVPIDSGVEHVLVVAAVDSQLGSLQAQIAQMPHQAPMVTVERDTPAAIVYSSGTTGKAKGVLLSHGNVQSNVTTANHHTGIQASDRLLLFVPLSHCFGQNAIMNCAIAAVATVVMHQRFLPEQILASVQKDQVTMFLAPPVIYVRLLNANIQPQDLAPVRYYFSAAAKMPVEISQRWYERFGQVIYEGYGLTETSPYSTYNHEHDYRFGSVGTPIQGVEIAILDSDDTPVAPKEMGEIAMRGPNVMLGYWNRPDETRWALRNGWLHSGDMGFMDEDGYVYIIDRIKDIINVSGWKVSPTEVENALYKHPAVNEAAVYGISHPETGEQVWASVVLKVGKAIAADDLIAFCREQIAVYKAPRIIHFVEALPKNGTGKLLKRVLIAEATANLQKVSVS